MYVIARVERQGIELSFNGANIVVFVKEIRGGRVELGVHGDLAVRIKSVNNVEALLPAKPSVNALAGLKRKRSRLKRNI
jgi:hypothetical protein